jgi:hypothetical protein
MPIRPVAVPGGGMGGGGGTAAPAFSAVPQLAQNLAFGAFARPQFGQSIDTPTVNDLKCEGKGPLFPAGHESMRAVRIAL